MTQQKEMKKDRGKVWREIKKNKGPYLLISPFFITFIIFGLFPVVFSVYLALSSWDGIGDMEFVGLRNFEFLIKDGCFGSQLQTHF